ncbi:ATP-dependent DNA helicase [Candidatus Harpocratesius sp.]
MGIRTDPQKKEFYLSVKDLVFISKQQVERPRVALISRKSRAIKGQELHKQFQSLVMKLDSTPGISVINEKSVKLSVFHKGWHFIITGRADSVQIMQKKVIVQEIKSIINIKKYSLNSPLFVGYCQQLLLYAHYFKQEYPFHEILPQLVIMEVGSVQIKIIDVPFESQTKYLEKQCDILLNIWKEGEMKKEQMRGRESSIVFPFSTYRPHQKEMIEQIDSALSDRKSVMLVAPTGLGKTAGSLFPALRHAVANNLRLFIVTSKTTQQKIYADTLRIMSKRKAEFHAVVLTAKEKMCINDTYLCDSHFCPYISDYSEEKVAGAVVHLLKNSVLEAPFIRRIAKKERLCPFELALDLSLECDVIVGDYNYVFNPRIRLQRYFDDIHNDCLIIVDEAHNLPDRAREYYSPSLLKEEIEEIIVFIHEQPISFETRKTLEDQLKDILGYLQKMHSMLKHELSGFNQRVVPVKVDNKRFSSWVKSLDKLVYQYVQELSKDSDHSLLPDNPFLIFIRSFTFFTSLLSERQKPEFQLLYYPKEYRLQIFCISAHRKLAQQIQGFYAVIMQSATLTPFEYYQKMLGLPKTTKKIIYPSPFPPENMLILNYTGLSTRYEHRKNSLQKIAELIITTVNIHPGNYLAFFPSFSYLDQVFSILENRNLPVEIIKQGRNMTERERKKTLKLLQKRAQNQLIKLSIQNFKKSQKHLRKNSSKFGILLCGVHGGIFSEGVDYEGDMGIGVFIIGPGLPSYNFEQELIKDYFQKTLHKGFEYAYRNPGMTRVIQAAGRIIRSSQDRGVIVLIGERFAAPYYAELFPKEWNIHRTKDYKTISMYLNNFW